jgi:hypothetical protein
MSAERRVGDIPVPGEWVQTFSPFKQKAFYITDRVLGANIALWLFGWYRYIRTWAKEHENAHSR